VEIHVKDIHTKKDLKDELKWVKFSRIAWKGNGFYYSRYDAPKSTEAYTAKNQFHKLYFHTVGTSQDQDQLIFEDKSHPDYNFSAQVTHDERYLIVYTSQSTSGDKFAVKDLSRGSSELQPMNLDFDYEYRVIENIGASLYVLTNHGAPKYKLIKINMNNPQGEKWKDILPERDDLLESVAFCNNKILANYLVDVSSHLSVHTLDGGLEKEISLPKFSKLNQLHAERPDTFFTYSVVQFTSPPKNYLYQMKTGETKEIFKSTIPFNSDQYVTTQVFYTSKDGTKIPMFITHKNNVVLDGNNPCFVFGYGGFNISYTPEFRIDRAVFLEAGGIYCVPNIRGGGEYGESWHKKGTKCDKQNVFDDFIAACNWLVDNKYTSHEKLAIHGRSNGGLLIGAVITQEPSIAKVAIPTVGVLDMLRFHKFTIGRAWTVDYGSSENEKEFECILKYSPLHNLKPQNYPATLILTGDHDDRVVPAHSFKFAATLQENNKGNNPTLIRIDVNAGHGAGKPTSKQIEEFADMWSFVFFNLNMQPK
jgi:prolyl oligopeptidase